jgi:hypothetical protein
MERQSPASVRCVARRAGARLATAIAGAAVMLASCAGERAPLAISPEASAAWALTQELSRPGEEGVRVAGGRPMHAWRQLNDSDEALAMVADNSQGGLLLVLVPRGQQPAPDPGAHAAYNAMLVTCPSHGGPLTKIADALVDVTCTAPAVYRAQLVALQSDVGAGGPL